jgi:hypothetical protein
MMRSSAKAVEPLGRAQWREGWIFTVERGLAGPGAKARRLIIFAGRAAWKDDFAREEFARIWHTQCFAKLGFSPISPILGATAIRLVSFLN